ncbi:MAG: citramalate synthase [Chloroflexota bacterium]
MRSVQLYDTTLRDGAQREGISFSVEDKLKIARKLDELGIHFIEGGWPGSNPKDSEFFTRARGVRFRQAELAAFGSTKRYDSKAKDDPNLKALVDSGAKVATIVGKSSRLQVTDVLGVGLETNLKMIHESVAYLAGKGLRVFFDAEHFFDGYKIDPDYSLRTLKVAADAGAEYLVLCDTNGGSLPSQIAGAVCAACRVSRVPIGIHAHNDADLAVANSLAAVEAGASQVQGTINGYGERCGNANLCSIIPDLKLKTGINCISDANLSRLAETAHFVAGVANMILDRHLPYVGDSAFVHKGGLHVSGLMKCSASYHHVDPLLVGNVHRVVVSELSGKGNILYKAKELGINLLPKGEETRRVLDQVKLMESRGFQYEDADASFELLLRRAQTGYNPPFELVDFMVVVERHRRMPTSNTHEETLAEATVKVRVGKKVIHTAAEGNGPVNALDAAMRKALIQFYPSVAAIKLVDYKVRILEEASGTASQVRVLIESTDGENTWRTVGGSSNIIEASWLALADSLEYWLIRHSGK